MTDGLTDTGRTKWQLYAHPLGSIKILYGIKIKTMIISTGHNADLLQPMLSDPEI